MLCQCRGCLALQSTGKCSDLLGLTVLALLPEALSPLLSGFCLQSIRECQSLLAVAVRAQLLKVLSINLLTESAGRVILQFARCQEVLWFTPLPKNLSLLYFSTCMQAHLQQEHCPAGVDYCPGRNYLVPDAAKGP